MGILVALVILPVFALGPFLISRKVYRKLQNYQGAVRILASGLTFLVSFSLILATVWYIVMINISFGR
jgi:hypothetical protein